MVYFNSLRAHRLAAGLGLVFSIVLFTGCAVFDGGVSPSEKTDLLGPFAVPAEYIVLPEPSIESTERDQIILMKLSEMLDTKATTNKDRAEIFYELGIVYDRLGLEGTARTMFSNSLAEKADFAAPYNFVGIYFSSDGRYQEACDAFGAAEELNPKDYYVNFNRGITLYYAGRYKLAVADMLLFYNNNKNDPYIMLWLYIAESELENSFYARTRLQQRYQEASDKAKEDNWGFNLVRLYLGTLSEQKFFNGTKTYRDKPDLMAEHLCEGYFYLGKKKRMEGMDKLAYDYYLLSLSTHRYGFLEYRYVHQEIRFLERKYEVRKFVYPQNIVPRF